METLVGSPVDNRTERTGSQPCTFTPTDAFGVLFLIFSTPTTRPRTITDSPKRR